MRSKVKVKVKVTTNENVKIVFVHRPTFVKSRSIYVKPRPK